jgi:glycine oxidase
MQRDANFIEATNVVGLTVRGDRVSGVVTPNGTFEAETTVLAAGVWSADVARSIDLSIPLKPVKGQILSLRGLTRAPRHVVWCGEAYLVPRPDGEIVLGATEEEGNYDARPTVAGVNRLTEAVLEVVPAAGNFTIDAVWAGLRPAAPDRYPIIGWSGTVDGLFIATAHYRNGVLLGPLTGQRVAAHLLSGDSLAEFEPFGPERFTQSEVVSTCDSSLVE